MEWVEGCDAGDNDNDGDEKEVLKLPLARPMSISNRLGHIEIMLEEGLTQFTNFQEAIDTRF